MLDKKTANANITLALKLGIAVGAAVRRHHRDRAGRRQCLSPTTNPFHLPAPSAQPLITSLGARR